MAASLLGLPREIRDEILTLAISHQRPMPGSPYLNGESRNRRKLEDINYKSWCFGPSNVKYDKREIKNNLFGTLHSLLLVNHQIAAETRAVLTRSRKEYTLDLRVVNEKEVWPTWTMIPAPYRHLDKVTATVRLFDSGNSQQTRAIDRYFHTGDRTPPKITWCFYTVLERFLRCGPLAPSLPFISRFLARPIGFDQGFTIKTLVLDFLSPPPPPPKNPKETVKDGASDLATSNEQESVDSMVLYKADWLANFVQMYMNALLMMSYHTAAYGGILYERIGNIELRVDGELLKAVPLDKTLAELWYNDPLETFGEVWPSEYRIPVFRAWKKKALLMRKAANLPVIWPNEDELAELDLRDCDKN
ncbi:hypothetical protein ASPZODRAFT_19202 [Penicilliopsis zonata CBS 506.65]|uniref:Uncharacterized protein n=1 Tax=Penicilliopsis zonata CBS 506.65 TaxID=1073090 RepID=A0A1L9S9N8_9EURO|nr:hypothetical protein ASPZODRAFT_19202 [Penicilliopsis zonata CBS 506.65]OJJ43902.1 hypothetical protein ASPZODRAFT_19202 [Penicilliopsis zonata CBS 506.65]